MLAAPHARPRRNRATSIRRASQERGDVPRSGLEAKPPWRSVPRAVRQRTQEALGSAIVRGARVWGGYGPAPTFRMALADGRRAFFKGTNVNSNDFARRALVREERAYQDLPDLLGYWMPRPYGSFRQNDWHVLLLEDTGPRRMPPWTPTATRRVAHAYAAFHAATLGSEHLPAWLPRPGESLPRVTWRRVAAESDDLGRVAALAGEQRELAHRWLRAALPLLSRLADNAANLPGPYALLHGDTRSDNLRFRDGRLFLFDWPSAEVGRPELDVVAFAQSITVEGGAAPEQFVAWYSECVTLDAGALDVALAWLAAFFADLAWRPDIPDLPRLRRFQRQQLAVVLPWLARRLRLPEPGWASIML